MEETEQILLRVHPSGLPAADRESTIRLLAKCAAQSMPSCGGSEEILKDAAEREAAGTTYLGLGLAVPHARVQGRGRAGIYAAFSRHGIPWPIEEAHIITFLVVPWEAPETHLQLLSCIVRWRRNLAEAELLALGGSPEKLKDSLSEALRRIFG